jgi:hypothetical protein
MLLVLERIHKEDTIGIVFYRPGPPQRLRIMISSEESRLVAEIIALSTQYGRYGYWRIRRCISNGHIP